MVTTILDSARIDRGVKEYHFQDADLADISRSVMDAMHYQLSQNGFSIRQAGFAHGRRYPVRADRDAVTQALVNIVANAIKMEKKAYFEAEEKKRQDAKEEKN